MTKAQLAVLRTIIAAVETGGNVYGEGDYGAFTEAYQNSSTEYSITLGRYQFYGIEAVKLLKAILADSDPQEPYFGALQRLSKDGWAIDGIKATSSLAAQIVAAITSDVGKRLQDGQIDEQLLRYVSHAKDLGVTDAAAQAMCANFEHQGGYGAVTRILAKTPKPYTLSGLYKATLTDTGNQVGAYKNRQVCVYNSILDHFPQGDVESIEKTREKAVKFMLEVARDDSHGYDQIYRWGEKGDYDCSSLVITAWQQAGVPVKDAGATYTGNMRNAFLECGFADVTDGCSLSTGAGLERGDVLLNEVHHTAMYVGDGMEAEASINEKGGATWGTPGDQTGREVLVKAYGNYPWDYVLRYTGGDASAIRPTIREGDTGEAVKEAQELLNKCGADLEVDGDFGPLTRMAAAIFQGNHLLNPDGVVGPKTWEWLLNQDRVIARQTTLRKSPQRKGLARKILKPGKVVTVQRLSYDKANRLWYRVKGGWIEAADCEEV